MKNTIVITALTFVVAAGILTANTARAKSIAPEKRVRRIDLAICLDTSGSMSGLIQSAKQKLWAVVNELATVRPKPVLRVALYHYGNDSLKAENGWVKQLCPLTTDLDVVYEKLFKLTTNGGTEYVARVMHAATTQLKWDKSKDALRIIFVAGNEPATQDKVLKLRDTCKAAITAGIIVNSIHCGSEATGRRTGWADVAAWTDGRYAAIDHDRGTVVIKTPHDKKLSELSAKLNTTYVVYGKGGGKGRSRQEAQDLNAARLNVAASAQRALAKSSGLYNNVGWDLVDASKAKDFDITKIKNEDLPKPMRKMNDTEKKAYIAKQAAGRAKIQKEVMALGKKRDAFVKAAMAKNGLSEKSSLDAALRKMIRTQAEKLNFKFAKPQAGRAAPDKLQGVAHVDMFARTYTTQRPALCAKGRYYPGGTDMVFKLPGQSGEVHAVFPKGIAAPKKSELLNTFTLHGRFKTIQSAPDGKAIAKPAPPVKRIPNGYRYFVVSSYECEK